MRLNVTVRQLAWSVVAGAFLVVEVALLLVAKFCGNAAGPVRRLADAALHRSGTEWRP